MHELILGGQRSGKSRCAEWRAARRRVQPGCCAVLLATALGRLHQDLAARCERVSLMVAGIEVAVKSAAVGESS